MKNNFLRILALVCAASPAVLSAQAPKDAIVITDADRTRTYLPVRDYIAVAVGRYAAITRVATGIRITPRIRPRMPSQIAVTSQPTIPATPSGTAWAASSAR